jgi:hypothetical protein
MDRTACQAIQSGRDVDRAAKKALQQGMQKWLEQKIKGQWIYPLTLEFKNGPWLYNADKDRIFEPLEIEIGVFMERLYQRGVKARYRKKDGWAFLGWPDKGGMRSFIHYHGFLILGPGQWMDHENTTKESDFKAWFDTIKAKLYGHEDKAVNYAFVSKEVQTIQSIKTFNGYASKWGVVEPVWYQAGQHKENITWTHTRLENGWQVWESGDFVIRGGKGSGFKVKERGLDVYKAQRLDSAKSFCEARLS